MSDLEGRIELKRDTERQLHALVLRLIDTEIHVSRLEARLEAVEAMAGGQGDRLDDQWDRLEALEAMAGGLEDRLNDHVAAMASRLEAVEAMVQTVADRGDNQVSELEATDSHVSRLEARLEEAEAGLKNSANGPGLFRTVLEAGGRIVIDHGEDL